MDRVNYVTYGTGYCDVCLADEYVVLVGDSDPKAFCEKCLPKVIEQMKDVGALVKFLKEKNPRG